MMLLTMLMKLPSSRRRWGTGRSNRLTEDDNNPIYHKNPPRIAEQLKWSSPPSCWAALVKWLERKVGPDTSQLNQPSRTLELAEGVWRKGRKGRRWGSKSKRDDCWAKATGNRRHVLYIGRHVHGTQQDSEDMHTRDGRTRGADDDDELLSVVRVVGRVVGQGR